MNFAFEFSDSINSAVTFKLSLTVLSCLSDMTYKKRNIANPFPMKTIKKCKLSKVVRFIETWV